MATAVTEAEFEEVKAALLRVNRRLEMLEAENKRLRPVSGAVAIEEPSIAYGGPSDFPGMSKGRRLTIQGDARLRYEHTRDQGDRVRNRQVLRARLAADYHLDAHITLGARLTTGDSDDPNSADVTLGNFVDDLAVSLDRAYVAYQGEAFSTLGGKFANPFDTRELVWDGDVNPQGVAASVDLWRGARSQVVARGLFSPIDEQIHSDDSSLLGAQLSVSLRPAVDWSLTASTAYYDYDIGGLATADAGDVRDNRLTADGLNYLSDFNLWDTDLRLTYKGFGEAMPLSLSMDYVRNLGAFDDQDRGYQLDMRFGRLKQPGDWGVSYAFSRADIDAVLTAFSQDNLTYASNYRQHQLALAYVPINNVALNLTTYLYSRDRYQAGYADDWDGWLSRWRMNISFEF